MTEMHNNVELQKAMKRVKIADRVRIFCLFVALLLVLFIFYGNKFAVDAAWYAGCKAIAYQLLAGAVMLMLAATIMKMIFATVYNRILKKKQ